MTKLERLLKLPMEPKHLHGTTWMTQEQKELICTAVNTFDLKDTIIFMQSELLDQKKYNTNLIFMATEERCICRYCQKEVDPKNPFLPGQHSESCGSRIVDILKIKLKGMEKP